MTKVKNMSDEELFNNVLKKWDKGKNVSMPVTEWQRWAQYVLKRYPLTPKPPSGKL